MYSVWELTVIPFLNDRFLNNRKMICLYVHGSYRQLDISEPGFGMVVCGCSSRTESVIPANPLWFGRFQ